MLSSQDAPSQRHMESTTVVRLEPRSSPRRTRSLYPRGCQAHAQSVLNELQPSCPLRGALCPSSPSVRAPEGGGDRSRYLSYPRASESLPLLQGNANFSMTFVLPSPSIQRGKPLSCISLTKPCTISWREMRMALRDHMVATAEAGMLGPKGPGAKDK